MNISSKYLYVTGGDELPNRLVRFPNSAPLPKLEVHKAAGLRPASVRKTPYGAVAHLTSSGVNTPQITSDVILFDGEKRIDFVNHVRKARVYTKEGVYFAFPFSFRDPSFPYEIQNGVVDPAKDQLPGAGKEWFSVQGWTAVAQNDMFAAIMPIDAPLVTFGDIVRGVFPSQFSQRKAILFSYVMNNYWEDNFVPGQGGDFTFHYSLTSGRKLDFAKLSRVAWSQHTPLEVNEVRSKDHVAGKQTPLNGGQGSFLKIDQPNVVLVNWKMAENENGSILRLLEVGGKPGTVRVSSELLRISSAQFCNAMEEDRQAIPVSPDHFSFDVSPFQIVTIRIQSSPMGRLAGLHLAEDTLRKRTQ